MCEVSLSDTVGEETRCAEMAGDRAFIRPTEGPLLLFWDLSWVQSEREQQTDGSHLGTHTYKDRGKKLHGHEK